MKTLQEVEDEWKTPQGTVIPLCVFHEINPRSTESVPAIATFGGMSVCRAHLLDLTQRHSRTDIAFYVLAAVNGKF